MGPKKRCPLRGIDACPRASKGVLRLKLNGKRKLQVFVGATDGSTSVLSMLKSLVQKLAMALGQEADEDEVRTVLCVSPALWHLNASAQTITAFDCDSVSQMQAEPLSILLPYSNCWLSYSFPWMQLVARCFWSLTPLMSSMMPTALARYDGFQFSCQIVVGFSFQLSSGRRKT